MATDSPYRIETGDLQFKVPETLSFTGQEQPGMFGYEDQAHQVYWRLAAWQGTVDLRPKYRDELRSDVEAEARLLFERYHRMHVDSGGEPPRTILDPGWSPVIDFNFKVLGNAGALEVVRRQAYFPAHEVIAGSLIIPTAAQTFTATASARSDFTGMREAMLVDELLRQEHIEDPEEVRRRLPQHQIDDPRHDVRFPDHILTRVRAALAWVGQVVTADFQLSRPPVYHAPQVELQGLDLALTLPPRYLFTSQDISGDERSAVFCRTTLPDAQAQLLAVSRSRWKEGEPLRSGDRLKAFAEANVRVWGQREAEDLEIRYQAPPDHGGMLQGEVYATYAVFGDRTQSLCRYLLDTDDEVFQFELMAPPCHSSDYLRAQMDGIVASFRRLDPPVNTSGAQPSQPPGQKWWSRFGLRPKR